MNFKSFFTAKRNLFKNVFVTILIFFSLFISTYPQYVEHGKNKGTNFVSNPLTNHYIKDLSDAVVILSENHSDIVYSTENKQFELIGDKTFVALEKAFDDGISRLYFELRFINGDYNDLMNEYNKIFRGSYITGSRYATRSFLLFSNTNFLSIIYKENDFSANKTDFLAKLLGSSSSFVESFSLKDIFDSSSNDNGVLKKKLTEDLFEVGYTPYIQKAKNDAFFKYAFYFLLNAILFFSLSYYHNKQSKHSKKNILLLKHFYIFQIGVILAYLISRFFGISQYPIFLSIVLVVALVVFTIIRMEEGENHV